MQALAQSTVQALSDFLREHARLLAVGALLAPFAYCALQLFARFA